MSANGKVAWSGEDMEKLINQWSKSDETHKATVTMFLQTEEVRAKWVDFVCRYGSQVRSLIDLKEAFAKDHSDEENETVMDVLSPLPLDPTLDTRKGMFEFLNPCEIALATVLFINNDHQGDSGGWSKKYEKMHEPGTDRTAYGKWNIKGGKPAFGSGLDPMAMWIYKQVKVMSEAVAYDRDLMEVLRVESLAWWDKQGTRERARKSNVKGKRKVEISYPVPACPPLGIGGNGGLNTMPELPPLGIGGNGGSNTNVLDYKASYEDGV